MSDFLTVATVPPIVLGEDLKNYFLEHVKHECSSGALQRIEARDIGRVYEVVKPLHVFKVAVAAECSAFVIVNLVIPVGAMVYARHGLNTLNGLRLHMRKMRASSAIVHSIRAFNHRQLPSVVSATNIQHIAVRSTPDDSARSSYDATFKYELGKTVTPEGGFCWSDSECASGIHFFLNLVDALAYTCLV
jgi:hypothetical protein